MASRRLLVSAVAKGLRPNHEQRRFRLVTRGSAAERLMEEIHETAGPAACFCRTHILDKLTPTRDVVSLCWRKRCRTLCDWEDERWAEQMLEDL